MTDLLQEYPDLVILSMDQMKLYFQATMTRVWALRGQTPMVRVTPRRDLVHFYGALDLRNGREIAVTAPQQTGAVTADFMRLLLLLFPTQHILLLLDRATWHRGPAIEQVLDENPRLELMRYPPACPDLNPQEHVWKATRQVVSHNHLTPHLPELADQFEDHLTSHTFPSSFLDRYDFNNICMMFN